MVAGSIPAGPPTFWSNLLPFRPHLGRSMLKTTKDDGPLQFGGVGEGREPALGGGRGAFVVAVAERARWCLRRAARNVGRLRCRRTSGALLPAVRGSAAAWPTAAQRPTHGVDAAGARARPWLCCLPPSGPPSPRDRKAPTRRLERLGRRPQDWRAPQPLRPEPPPTSPGEAAGVQGAAALLPCAAVPQAIEERPSSWSRT